MPERLERLRAMKASLKGISFDSHIEPSHSLCDKVMAMMDEQAIAYVELGACTSRESEIQQIRKEAKLDFTPEGLLKLSKQDKSVTADVTGERKVRACLQRRALAFHMSGMAKYQTIDAFISRCFNLMDKPAAAGFHPVSVQQVIQADLALWQLVSQKTRGNVYAIGDVKPVDQAISEAAESLEVMYHLLPLPSGTKRVAEHDSSGNAAKRQRKGSKGNKGNGKGLSKGPKGLGKGIHLPPNCAPKNDNDENICFGYNTGKCKMRGYKCRRGVHCCWMIGCFGKHPHTECPNKKNE